MTFSPARLALGAIGLAIGVVGVLALREATLSTHGYVDPESQVEVVVDARSSHGEASQSLTERVEALLLTCRLEVSSDIVGPIRDEGNGRFRAVLQPELDQTNRRQFRGCLEDWTVDNLWVDVIGFEAPSRSGG